MSEHDRDRVDAPTRSGLRRLTPRSSFAGAVVWGGIAYAVVALLFSLAAFRGAPHLLAVAFFVGLAACGTGCVAGFLFGVPKMATDTSGTLVTSGAPGGPTAAPLLFNTNLGQISDWTTKIVVGLGLVQFRAVLEGAGWLATRLGQVFAGDVLTSEQASAYGLSLVIGAITISFLLMYMWTATRLPEVWSD